MFRNDTSFVAIIDRRQNNWSSVRDVLFQLRISKIKLRYILILRPSGFQAVFSEATFRFIDLGFDPSSELKILTHQDQLLEYCARKVVFYAI
jgi:hypothetical protein